MMIKRIDGLKRYTIKTEYDQTSIHVAGELLDYVNVTDLIEAWYKPEEQKRLTRKVVLGVLKEHNFKVLKYKNDLYISAGRLMTLLGAFTKKQTLMINLLKRTTPDTDTMYNMQ